MTLYEFQRERREQLDALQGKFAKTYVRAMFQVARSACPLTIWIWPGRTLLWLYANT